MLNQKLDNKLIILELNIELTGVKHPVRTRFSLCNRAKTPRPKTAGRSPTTSPEPEGETGSGVPPGPAHAKVARDYEWTCAPLARAIAARPHPHSAPFPFTRSPANGTEACVLSCKPEWGASRSTHDTNATLLCVLAFSVNSGVSVFHFYYFVRGARRFLD